MKSYLFVAGLVVASTVMVSAEWVSGIGEGWRLTVGGGFGFNAKGKLDVQVPTVGMPKAGTTGNRAEAQAAGDAVTLGSGRSELGNGAFYDANDSAGRVGESWNWRIPAGALDSTRRMTEAHPFAESRVIVDSSGERACIHDDSPLYGAEFGLDRAIWKEGRFGVEAGFNFGFFIRKNFLKGVARGWSAAETTTTGSYLTDVAFNSDVFDDPWAQNADGSYGAGSFDGPGPVLNADEIAISHRWGDEMSTSRTYGSGPLTIRGDLQMYEFQLVLKPYYELTDWFRVHGAWGVGVDYRDFDVHASGNGTSSFHDWDVYMLCGVGGMFTWKEVNLGVDFLRKVFDDDLDVRSRYVNGSISNSEWYLRVYVGYQF